MDAHRGDVLLMHGRIVGEPDREGEIVEVMGDRGQPPYRLRFADGHESVVSPGPDCVVLPHRAAGGNG
jgi:hypothetical protein